MFIQANRQQAGVTLIELIMFIVIVSVGLAGVLASLTTAVKGSADPLQPKQALAIAEAVLEEIELKDYCDPSTPSEAGAISFTGDLTTNSNTISGITDTSAIQPGWQVTGANMPGGATVVSTTASSVTLSSAIYTTGTVVPLIAATCESKEASRDLFDNVRDYHDLTESDAKTLNGTAITGYELKVSVPASTVAIGTSGSVPALQIVVSVKAPSGSTYSLTGYRVAY